MSPKTTKTAAVKKESGKKTSGSATPPGKAEKTEKKSTKAAAELPIEDEVEKEASAVDLEELEEQQEEEAAAAQGGNAAALAAAAGQSSEMSASFKNFRHHPDMENFYRFIYENDLRHEALAILDEIIIERQQKKVVTKK